MKSFANNFTDDLPITFLFSADPNITDLLQVLCRYSSGFAGEVISNESAVVENASFLFRSLCLPYEVPPLDLHIQIYSYTYGFARFPGDSKALVNVDVTSY